MKIKHQVSFNNIEILEKILKEKTIPFKLVEGLVGRLVIFEILNSDKRWNDLKEILKHHNVNVITGTEFEPEDYANANWFLINARETGYPEPQGNFDFLDYSFDVSNYCKRCGVGLMQNNHFLIKSVPKLKIDFFTLNWIFDELFVKNFVKHQLQEADITGISFKEVIRYKDMVPFIEICQLKIMHILDGGLDPYNCIIETCDDHQSSEPFKKYNYPLLGGVTIKEDVFPTSVDFVKSREWFGSGAEAHRLMLCSKKVYNQANSNKWKGLKFTPVFHEQVHFENT